MQNPKLIKTWQDQDYPSAVSEYKYENGVRLVVAKTARSLSFEAGIMMEAGGRFEHHFDVPDGTAHFLEHLMVGNPNKKFKTRQAKDNYEYGTRKRPSLYLNGYTNMNVINVYGQTHFRGRNRLLKALYYQIDYPEANLEKYLEKERKIILAELARLAKPDRLESLQADILFKDGVYAEEDKVLIGNKESINSITLEDIHKWYKLAKCPHNAIICVQTGRKIDTSTWNHINQIAALFDQNSEEFKTPKVDVLQPKHALRLGYFNKPDMENVFLSVTNYYQKPLKYDYQNVVFNMLMPKMIYKVLFEILREEENLIYSCGSIHNNASRYWKIRGFNLNCEPQNFDQIVARLYPVLFDEVPKFILSKEGKDWLESTISDYIFPSNQDYDSSYADDIGYDVLYGRDYEFDSKYADEIAKQVTAEQLLEFYQENFLNVPPNIWVTATIEEDQLIPVVKNSEFYRNYQSN